jgi:nucleoside-diphosphate-sugar epimerase
MQKISILGCGWLGIPLAEALIKNGFSVSGSTTSIEKISFLNNLGVEPFLLSIEGNTIKGDVLSFLKESSVLIINIPPKLRGNLADNFVEKIAVLIPFIEKSNVEKVLFVSSTSVYGDSNKTVFETTIPVPESENGKQLLASEKLLQENKTFKTTVIRFGGLIGKDRHPVTFLAGRSNLENPNAPINLIHQDDCIGIILKILKIDFWNETLNAVAPFHPTREEYYTKKATELHLDLPTFNYSKPSKGKFVSSKKIEKELGFQFSKPQLK